MAEALGGTLHIEDGERIVTAALRCCDISVFADEDGRVDLWLPGGEDTSRLVRQLTGDPALQARLAEAGATLPADRIDIEGGCVRLWLQGVRPGGLLPILGRLDALVALDAPPRAHRCAGCGEPGAPLGRSHGVTARSCARCLEAPDPPSGTDRHLGLGALPGWLELDGPALVAQADAAAVEAAGRAPWSRLRRTAGDGLALLSFVPFAGHPGIVGAPVAVFWWALVTAAVLALLDGSSAGWVLGAIAVALPVAAVVQRAIPRVDIPPGVPLDDPDFERWVADLARRADLPSPHGIVLIASYHAMAHVHGLRGRRTLYLGVPMVERHNTAELAAVMIHELAHLQQPPVLLDLRAALADAWISVAQILRGPGSPGGVADRATRYGRDRTAALLAARREEERRADRMAARHADPGAIRSVLQRGVVEHLAIERLHDTVLAQATQPPHPSSLLAACVDGASDAWKEAQLATCCSTPGRWTDPHLQVGERLAALPPGPPVAAPEATTLFADWPARREAALAETAAALEATMPAVEQLRARVKARLADLADDATLARTHVLAARLHASVGDAEAAIAAYDRALARDPSHDDAWTESLDLRLLAGPLAEAARHARRLPTDAGGEPWALAARILAVAGATAEACEAFDRARERPPPHIVPASEWEAWIRAQAAAHAVTRPGEAP